jgi:hypothetical protein
MGTLGGLLSTTNATVSLDDNGSTCQERDHRQVQRLPLRDVLSTLRILDDAGPDQRCPKYRVPRKNNIASTSLSPSYCKMFFCTLDDPAESLSTQGRSFACFCSASDVAHAVPSRAGAQRTISWSQFGPARANKKGSLFHSCTATQVGCVGVVRSVMTC